MKSLDVVALSEEHNHIVRTLHQCWLCGYVTDAPEGEDEHGRPRLPDGWIYLFGGLKSCSSMMFPSHPLPEEAGPDRPLVLTGYLFTRLRMEEYLGISRTLPSDDGTDPHQGN